MRPAFLSGYLLGLITIAACASAPSVKEYFLDPKAQMLRASKPEDDRSTMDCIVEQNGKPRLVCYVYMDQDVRKIKKYIVELETRLKACEERH